MKKGILIALSLLLLSFTSLAAYAQVPVNIVYPINGGTYPVGGGAATGGAEYIEASFGVTCSGGPHNVRWGFNGGSVGSAEFYDQISVQQTYKLPAGVNTFTVQSDCGNDRVWFRVDH